MTERQRWCMLSFWVSCRFSRVWGISRTARVRSPVSEP